MTDIFSNPGFDNHEQVIFVTDSAADLRGIITIHNTALGPAAGGCRMQPYESVDEALYDVLRLSQGMTLKNAVAGLPLGGGKCVIIADPNSSNKKARLQAMARHVQRLGGNFWTAIDVGVSSEDADVMAAECDYIFARASEYPDGFNPSHFTALGGFHGIRAVAHHLNGTDDLRGLRVAIQGVGATGTELTRRLVKRGAVVTIADVDERAVAKVMDQHPVSAVEPNIIHAQDVDVFAPCALGAVLNAPDFVVNAGGMMGTSTVIFSKPDREKALANIETIFTTINNILEQSRDEGKPSAVIAEEMAIARIRNSA
jgi:leucine dehydrogenase